MGFRQKNSATVFLALLGLGNILGVNGSWLFGAMEEREEDYRRAMQPRQFVQCSSGSKACGILGCVASRRCCNADAGWGCLTGNACYTANGFIDCYSTTMVMPTASRKCYDFTQSGCTAGMPCFKCGSTAAFCATEVIAGGGDTWLECATKSTILTVTAAAETTGSDSTPTNDVAITPATGGTGTSAPARTGTTISSPTSTSTSGLSGGTIAGIVVGGVAGIAIIAGLIFFLCVKKGNNDANGAAATQQQQYQQQQQQPPMQQPPSSYPPMSYPPPQQPYSPPPQQQYAPQPPYSPLPGYQGQMAHNGYGPDGQPLAPPISSPVYPEPQKQQPVPLPAELH